VAVIDSWEASIVADDVISVTAEKRHHNALPTHFDPVGVYSQPAARISARWFADLRLPRGATIS
jgi:hypothetical protein